MPGDSGVEQNSVRLRVDAMDGLRIVQLRITLPADELDTAADRTANPMGRGQGSGPGAR